MDEIIEFFATAFGAAGVLSFFGYFFREAIVKFFSRSLDSHFDHKLESFSAEIRSNEKELDEIRSFLISTRKERESIIQLKKLQGAEDLLRSRHLISQLTLLVEYVKVINIDAMLASSDPKISEFVRGIVKPLDVDKKIEELKNFDKTHSRLYLSEETLKLYDIYEKIIMQSVLLMKTLEIDVKNKEGMIKKSELSKDIIKLVPSSKEGFEQYGEDHAYYWLSYFHDEILRSLRHEISGVNDIKKDTASISRLAFESRQAQFELKSSLEKAGLPQNLINLEKPATGR